MLAGSLSSQRSGTSGLLVFVYACLLLAGLTVGACLVEKNFPENTPFRESPETRGQQK